MSYNPAHYLPLSPPQRWEGREPQHQKQGSYARPNFYPTPPPSASLRSFPQAHAQRPALPPRPTRHRWPPSPWVEEESKSIAREQTPELYHSDDDIPLRGSQEQQPIILEADASSDSESESQVRLDNYRGTDSSSSTDSSGPKTPTGSSQNEERRFIFVGESRDREKEERHGSDGEEEHDRRGSYVRVRPDGYVTPPSTRSKSPTRSRSPRPNLRVDPTLKEKPMEQEKEEPLPYTGPRASTPYTYSGTPKKSMFPENYLMYPENQTRKTAMPTPRGRQNELRAESSKEKHRTLSSSQAYPNQKPKPMPMRHQSALGTPGENARSTSYERDRRTGLEPPISAREPKRNVSPLGNQLKPSQSAVESDSEYTESDPEVSPDEPSPPRRKRGTQYSMTASELRNLSEAPKADSMRKPRPEPIETGRVRSSQPPRKTTLQTTQGPTHKAQSSVNLSSRSFPQEMKQKMPDPNIRPDPRKSPYNTPPASPGRESLRTYFASPPSSGSATRPGSRSGSKPNSRPSTPPVNPQRSSTLEIPGDFKAYANNSSTPGYIPPSRPSTPSSVPKTMPSLDPRTPTSNNFRRDTLPRSRNTSPLPSPAPSKVGYDEGKLNAQPQPQPARTFPMDNKSPRNRDFSFSQPSPTVHHPTRLAPVPDEMPGRRSIDSQRSTYSPQDGPPRSPTVFRPTLKKPPARGIPSLPACPRPHYTKGCEDWSTLPGHTYFDVCPTCKSSLEGAGFTDQFIPSPRRSPDYATRCDMSNLWIRMAWLLLIQDRAKDCNIVHDMTTVLYHEPPCPGRDLTPRPWHRLFDPETNRYVPNFDVCPACLKSLEHLFPNLRGAFHLLPYPPASNARTCDLRTDSPRFARYVDTLEGISAQATELRREPNMHRFVQLARTMASRRECARDDQLTDSPWHFPPSCPDFAVCEECYMDVVYPALRTGPSAAAQIAEMFGRTLQLPPPHLRGAGLSCQLYSERMRGVWRECCERGDWRGLKEEVLRRVGKERELQRRHREVLGWRDEGERSEEGRRLVREWARWA
ncbi:MAG: hypothetical protein MMC23_007488 [Stictis urceolatum]|nr:hypothetical protein [Stictis urceolata]